MKNFLKGALITLVAIFVFIILVFAIGLIGAYKDGYFSSDYVPPEDKALLTKEKYGEEYPYTIDNLRLKCENQAVWVEDSALNKYALNGLAYNKFQGRGDFKGYTSEIQIPDKKPDSDFLNMGFELCKQ